MHLNLKLVQISRKAPPPPPHPRMRENFLYWIYPFQAILSNFGFCGRKTPPLQDEGFFFYTGSIHFRQFQATLVFVAEKPPPPPPPQDDRKFFTLDLSISGNFKQLWFLWQKPLPPGWGEIFLHWIYPFQSISNNFGFCGRKAPHPPNEGMFLHWIYPFQAILSNFGFCGRKAPPPRMREIFLHWIYPFQAISRNFGFCGRKAPPDEGKFFTLDLSISGNFQQLWFLWQESTPPPRMREDLFLHWLYQF